MSAPRSSVAMPVPVTAKNQASVPPSAGEKRISRKTPAFTMVAECRKADTGVGAAMAPGSQKWKGNCADLVKAPIRNRTSTTRYIGSDRMIAPEASTTSRS